jgi:hypothetical protein
MSWACNLIFGLGISHNMALLEICRLDDFNGSTGVRTGLSIHQRQ